MADDFDRAGELEEAQRQHALANRQPFVLEPGKPGDCEMCGEWSGRLVGGACTPCRDTYKLP